MTPKSQAWLKLITLAVGTGAAIGITSYSGGAKPAVAAVVGLGAAASAVYHALSDSPNQSTK